MDDMKLIGGFRQQLMGSTVWKETIYDYEGAVDAYWIELQNGRGETFGLDPNQIPELIAVLEQAARCIEERAPDALKFKADDLFAASRDAESSRNPL